MQNKISFQFHSCPSFFRQNIRILIARKKNINIKNKKYYDQENKLRFSRVDTETEKSTVERSGKTEETGKQTIQYYK